jgi:protein-disulfide isomerase
MNFKLALIGLTSLTLASCGTQIPGVGGFSDQQKKDIQKIIADYLETNPDAVGKALENKPEMILQAIKKLGEKKEAQEKQRAQEAIVKEKDTIFKDSEAPFSGNSNGKKVLVEFFDYNCPHCREMSITLKELISQDKDIKIIYKLWPMFGKDSEYAARAVLAAKAQGKFQEVHEAFMGSPDKLEESKVLEIVKKLGLDMTKFEKDVNEPAIKEQLVKVRNLADKLEIAGAPYIIYENEIIPGKVDLDELKAVINKK